MPQQHTEGAPMMFAAYSRLWKETYECTPIVIVTTSHGSTVATMSIAAVITTSIAAVITVLVLVMIHGCSFIPTNRLAGWLA